MCCMLPSLNFSKQQLSITLETLQYLHIFNLLEGQFVGVYSYLEAQLFYI